MGLGREGTPKTPGEISTKLGSSILSFTFFSLDVKLFIFGRNGAIPWVCVSRLL